MRQGPRLAMVHTHKGLEVLGLIAVTTRTLSVCAKCKTKPNNIPLAFLLPFKFWPWRQYWKSNEQIMFTVPLLSQHFRLISTMPQFLFSKGSTQYHYILEKGYCRTLWKNMTPRQRWVQHRKAEHFHVDMENRSLKSYHSLVEVDSFAESSKDTLRWLGIQLSLAENTFHMYWVL